MSCKDGGPVTLIAGSLHRVGRYTCGQKKVAYQNMVRMWSERLVGKVVDR
jgi:hypothetical protein